MGVLASYTYLGSACLAQLVGVTWKTTPGAGYQGLTRSTQIVLLQRGLVSSYPSECPTSPWLG